MTSPHDEHDEALGKSLADRFRDGDTSDEPVTPVDPENADTPVEPENADTQVDTETPETPDETVTPDETEIPVEPETPETPETPTPATPVSSLQERLTSDTYEPPSQQPHTTYEPPAQQPHTTYEKNPYTPTPHHQGGYPPQNPAPDYSSPAYPQRTQDWGEYHDPFPSSTVPQAYANAGAHPVEPYGHYGQVQYQGDDEQKSMLLAFLLAFFTGPFGIHNFYLGYTGRAVTQLTLTLVGLVTAIILVGFIFLLVTMVWATVDWIMILVDKNYKDADGKNLDRG